MSNASTSSQHMEAVFVDIESRRFTATKIFELERIEKSDPPVAKVCFINKSTGAEEIVTISTYTYNALKDYQKHYNNAAAGI